MAIKTISTLGGFFQKIGKMLKTSMSYYAKSSVMTYPFYFINRQSIHKTNCMQRIKKILMRKVFPAIALKPIYSGVNFSLNHIVSNDSLNACFGFLNL